MSCSDFPKLRRGKRGFYDRGEKEAHKIFDSVVMAAYCHINFIFQLASHLCFFNKRILWVRRFAQATVGFWEDAKPQISRFYRSCRYRKSAPAAAPVQ